MTPDLRTRVARAILDAGRKAGWTVHIDHQWQYALPVADAALLAIGIPVKTLEKLVSGELLAYEPYHDNLS